MNPADPVDAASPLQPALLRLARSRAALRRELLPDDAPAGSALGGGTPPSDPLRRLWRRLRRAAHRSPVVEVLAGAARGWWRQQAWRPAGAQLVRQAVPMVQRHPWAAVALAAGVGAALAGLRPWRWPAVGRTLRPLPGQALRWLLGQLGSAPMQAALASLALMAMHDDAPGPGDATQPSANPGASPAPPPSAAAGD